MGSPDGNEVVGRALAIIDQEEEGAWPVKGGGEGAAMGNEAIS